MTTRVRIYFNHCFATYKVEHEVDGIYKATLLNNWRHTSYQFPENITLFHTGQAWTSDYHVKEIGLLIGQKIDETEDTSLDGTD